MTKDIALKVISAVTGLALVAGGIYLLTIGQEGYGAALIAGGTGTVGLPSLVGSKATPGGES